MPVFGAFLRRCLYDRSLRVLFVRSLPVPLYIPFAFHFRGHEENLVNAGKPENLAMKPRATEKPLSEDSHGLALLPYEPGGPALAVGR